MLPKHLLGYLFLILGLVSCQRDSQTSFRPQESVERAHEWFKSYQARTKFDKIFLNVDFQWEKASIFKFKNGNSAITVPILEKNQNLYYQGIRMLYLYPWKNGKGYYSVVYEFLPDLNNVKANRGKINLDNYSGLLCSWSLQNGFLLGAGYEKGIVTNRIFLSITKDNKKQAAFPVPKPPPSAPSFGDVYSVIWASYQSQLINDILMGGGGSYGNNPCEYSCCTCDTQVLKDYFDFNINDYYATLDQRWLNEKIIDNTNNPCVANALNTLRNISEFLPKNIRDFYGFNPTFSITLQSVTLSSWTQDNNGNSIPPVGGKTPYNTTSNQFVVNINDYYKNITDLGLAATMIHEAMHCQLMDWYRRAINDGDVALQQQLSNEYGYLFGVPPNKPELQAIVDGLNPTQHQDIIDRYQDIIATAIYAFATAKNISISFEYCKDLAWTGCFDSKAFKNLPFSRQTIIQDRVLAEKDPYSNLIDPYTSNSLNPGNANKIGHPCK